MSRAGSAVAWTAVIRDVSARGLGLLLPRRFEPGAVLFVEPFGLTGYATRVLPAKVVRVTARDGGAWLIGCEFLTELREDEVSALR
jgi:hypothetical protein